MIYDKIVKNFYGIDVIISYNNDEINIKWKYSRKGIILKYNNGCFECINHSSTWNGYPRVKFNNIDYRMNRFIYCLFNDKSFCDIKNRHIRHTCDNRKCCYECHLIEGFRKDNMNDMCIRGRQARGEKICSSKLDEVSVRSILLSDSPNSYLAELYNVSKKCIEDIKNRITWKHIVIDN